MIFGKVATDISIWIGDLEHHTRGNNILYEDWFKVFGFAGVDH